MKSEKTARKKNLLEIFGIRDKVIERIPRDRLRNYLVSRRFGQKTFPESIRKE